MIDWTQFEDSPQDKETFPLAPVEGTSVDWDRFEDDPAPLQKKAEQNITMAAEAGVNPDDEAELQHTSRSSGYPVSYLRDLQQDPSLYRRVRLGKVDLSITPRGYMGYFGKPDNVAISYDDTENLKRLSNVRKLIKSWDRGQAVVGVTEPYGAALRNIIATGNLTDTDLDAITKFEDRNGHLLDADSGDDGILMEIGKAAAEMLPMQLYIGAKAAEETTIGAMGGGAVGSVVPGVGTVAGAGTGAVVGWRLGSAEGSFNIEAANALREFLQLEDEFGNKIDPRVAAAASLAVGTVNAGLEVVAFRSLVKLIPGADKVSSKLVNGTVKQALKNPTVRNAILRTLKDYGEAIGTESLTEMAQEMSNVIFGEIAKMYSDRTEGTAFDGDLAEVFSQENLYRIGQAGKQAALGTIGLGGPAVIGNTARRTHEALTTQEFQDQAVHIKTLVDETKTQQRSPEKMKEFMQMTGMDQEAFMDADTVTGMFQDDEEGTETFFQSIGVNPDTARQQARQGQDIKVSMAEAYTGLDAERFAGIIQHMKAAPGGSTVAELQGLSLPEEVRAVAARFDDMIGVNTEIDRLRAEAAEAGVRAKVVDGELVGRDYVDHVLVPMAKRLYGDDLQAMGEFMRKHTFATDKWKPESAQVEGAPEGVVLHQPIDEGVDLDQVLPFVDVTEDDPLPINMDGVREFRDLWVGADLEVDTKTDQGKWKARPSEGKAKRKNHPVISSKNRGKKHLTRRKSLRALDRLLDGAALIETIPAKHEGTSQTFRFYVPVMNEGKPALMRIVAHEMDGQKAQVEGVEIYDIMKEDPASGMQAKDLQGPTNAGSSGVTIRQMMTGVKDAEGQFYIPGLNLHFSQGARAAIQFKDDRTLVKLFEGKANTSSIFHEGAHDFLQELRTLVEAGEATPDLVHDWDIIRNWLGVEGTKISEEQHERFASGFEKYLHEGKSPTTELEKLFARFRRWLTEVYKTARELDVELNNEVRGVFDRMMMADQAVAARSEELGLVVLDKRAMDALGILPEDQTYLARMMQNAQESASQKMFSAMHKAVKAARAKWKEEGEAEALNDPMHDTVRRLQKGRGIDRQAVYDIWGKEVADRMPWRTVKHGGLHPDAAAVEAGFDSAEQLFDALEAYKPVKQQVAEYVEQKIKESDASFQADDFILQTDEYAEYLTVLSKYLDGGVMGEEAKLDATLNRNGVASRKTLSRAAFKQYALDVMEQKAVRDAVRLDIFLGAVKKAAAMETQALRRNDSATARQANERMRLNYEMSRESKRIRDFVDKIVKKVKLRSRLPLGRIDERYQKNVTALAMRFGFIDGDPGAIQGKPSLTSLLRDEESNFDAASNFGEWLLEGDAPRDYRNLSVQEFRELAALFDTLYGLGKMEKEQRLSSLNANLDQVRMEMHEVLEQGKQIHKPEPGTLWSKVYGSYRKYLANTDMLLFVVRQLDHFTNVSGNGTKGPFETYIYDALRDAHARRIELKRQVFGPVKQALAKLEARAAQLGKRIDIEGVPVPPLLAHLGHSYWKFDQVLALALNRGNMDNWSKTLEGYGLTAEEGERILALLTDEDWDAVQTLWDNINVLWEPQAAANRGMWFFTPPKVEAQPFVTATGKRVHGGYYPLKFETRLDTKAAARQEALDGKSWQQGNARWQRASVRSGQMKTRKESAGGMPVKLSVSVLAEHLDQAVNFASHAETVRDLSRILRDKALRMAVENKIGPHGYEMLLDVLQRVSNPEAVFRTAVDNWIANMGSLVTGYVLGLNRSVAAKQAFSLPGFMKDHGGAVSGSAVYINGWAQVMKFGNPRKAYKAMLDLSPTMEDRQESAGYHMLQLAMRTFGKSRKLKTARDGMFILIRAVDALVVVPAWWGSYNKGMKKFGGDAVQAVRYADEMIAASQPVTREFDKSSMQAHSKGMAKLFTFFASFVMRFENRKRLHTKAFLAGKMPFTEYATHWALERILPPIAMNLMFAAIHGEEPDRDDLIFDSLLYQICGLPFVREVVGVLANEFRRTVLDDKDVWSRGIFSGTPLASVDQIVTNGVRGLFKMINDLGDTDTMIEGAVALTEMAAFFMGVGAIPRQTRSVLEGIRQYEEEGGTIGDILVTPNPDKRR